MAPKKEVERALPTKTERLQTLRTQIDKYAPQIVALIPKHLTPERLFAIANVAISRNPALLECTTISVLRSIAVGSQLGLDVSGVGGQGHIVPFKNKAGFMEAQFIPGYQGLIELARRSRDVVAVRAKEVYQNDDFFYEDGSMQVLKHKPSLGAEPGQMVGAYAVAHFASGFAQAEVMSAREIEAVRTRSRAGKSEFSPWHTDPGQMWRKTVVRRLCKYLPQNPDLARAQDIEDRAEAGEPSTPLEGEEEDIGFSPLAVQSQTEKVKGALGIVPADEGDDAADPGPVPELELEREPGQEG